MLEEYNFSKFKFPNNISDKAVIGILFRVENKESKIETKKVLKYFNFMNYNIKDNKKKIIVLIFHFIIQMFQKDFRFFVQNMKKILLKNI